MTVAAVYCLPPTWQDTSVPVLAGSRGGGLLLSGASAHWIALDCIVDTEL